METPPLNENSKAPGIATNRSDTNVGIIGVVKMYVSTTLQGQKIFSSNRSSQPACYRTTSTLQIVFFCLIRNGVLVLGRSFRQH